MPSFDVVSNADLQEVRNAVDQARREVANRYDLKDAAAELEFDEAEGIKIEAADEYVVNTITDLVVGKLVRRRVDPLFFQRDAVETAPSGRAKRLLALRQGLAQELAKKIAKRIKDTKFKVQAQIRGDELRVTGKKRDDLQEVIRVLKSENYDQPLQFVNFRD